MKKIYLLTCLITSFAFSQVINFPDPVFKAKLLEADVTNNIAKNSSNQSMKIDTNNNSEIEVSEAQAVYRLFYHGLFMLDGSNNEYNSFNTQMGLTNLSGIENFINLQYLDVSNNSINTLSLVSLTNLYLLKATNCNLNSINFQGLNSLNSLDLSNNLLTSIDFSNLNSLRKVNCNSNLLQAVTFLNNMNLYEVQLINNQIISLDFSTTSLYALAATGNPNLTYLNIKNGVYSHDYYNPSPPLTISSLTIQVPNTIDIICKDDYEIGMMSIITQNLQNVIFTTYCTLTPGGNYNTLSGNVKYDCGGLNLNIQNVKINVANGAQTGYVFTNNFGNYNYYTGVGTINMVPQYNNSYFAINPLNATTTFTSLNNTFNQNFCLVNNGSHSDLKITIIPLNPARPGFDANYNVIVTNAGNETQSGSINLNFNDNVLDYITSSPLISNQVVNQLTWNYSNLAPFQTLNYIVTFNLNSPIESPPLNSGDNLQYNVQVNSSFTDETPLDNVMQLNQNVVNSNDPNDKTCLEGNFVAINDVNKYLHYLIRFQNVGTASAVNVVVTDVISDKLDGSTLEIESSSHNYTATLKNGKLEVIYENINLPNASSDEPGSHGYIAFRIKPKSTVVLNDVINNTANIYFDFNHPVITNTTSTQFVTLSTEDFITSQIKLYPNPVKDILNIQFESLIIPNAIKVYNLLGQKMDIPTNDLTKINCSNLKPGCYILEVQTDRGKATYKFIKE